MSDLRTFEVHGSGPREEREGYTRGWKPNWRCVILAATLMRAAELALAKHPGGELHAVQHRGQIDIIDDSATP